jgi:CspA family cold shock protein
MEYKGIVKWFDAKKGFGFIVSERFETDIMLHYSQLIMEGFKTTKTGDRVTFSLDDDRKAGLAATEIKVIG